MLPSRNISTKIKVANQDPLHGVTLQMILEELVKEMGWKKMAENVNINCFSNQPSITSSLRFLRRTPWARKEVEGLYIYMVRTREDDAKAKAENP